LLTITVMIIILLIF